MLVLVSDGNVCHDPTDGKVKRSSFHSLLCIVLIRATLISNKVHFISPNVVYVCLRANEIRS